MIRKCVAVLVACLALGGGLVAQDIWVDAGAAPGGDGSQGNPFNTIQDGIDNVGSGGTVNVAPGLYVETLLVDPLGVYGPAHGQTAFTIEGTGAGVIIQWPDFATVRQPGWNPAIVTNSGKQADFILWAHQTTGLTLRNLEFDGNDDMATTGSTTSTAIGYKDATGSVEDCTIYGVQISPSSGAQNGLAVYVEDPMGGHTVSITGCDVSEIQKSFIVSGYGGHIDVSDCTLTGRGPTGSIAQNGIQISYDATGTVSGCVLDGFWWTGATWTSTAILIYLPGTPVSVSNSTLLDCQTGIYIQGDGANPLTATVTGCTLSQVSQPTTEIFPAGIIVYDLGPGSTYSITNSSFNNHQDVGLATWSTGGTITGNYFNNNGSEYNFWNAQDESSGGNNWDGNSWSDFTVNPGYPTTYVVPGAASAVDNSPSGTAPYFNSTDVAVGLAPDDVILVDLIGSSELDIATADSGGDTVTVLENDGAGGFPASTTTVSLVAGDEPAALVAGDLDGAGGTDLAVACLQAATVRIVTNDGLGTFTLGSAVATPKVRPVALAAGDINGGGVDDIVVAMEGDIITGDGGLAVILDGGAATMLDAPGGGFLAIKGVCLGDLDADGDLDLVATMAGSLFSPSVSDNVLFYENDGGGAGGFTYRGALSVPQNPSGVVCGDLDGDDDLDIGLTAESWPNTFPGATHVYLNGGMTAGAWDVATDLTGGGSFEGGTLPGDVGFGDLGDDSIHGFFSRQDLMNTNFGSANVTRFNGYIASDQKFSAIQVFSAAINPVALDIGHLDGNRTLDAVVANKSSNDVSVIRSVAQALAQTFGTGCTGSNGIPQIAAVGLPTLGNTHFEVALSNARAYAPVLLGLSLSQATTNFGGNCNLYLQVPLVLLQTVTNGAGETTMTIPIPATSSAEGLNIYFQYFVFDPLGEYNHQIAFSNGLRIKVGY